MKNCLIIPEYKKNKFKYTFLFSFNLKIENIVNTLELLNEVSTTREEFH